MKMTFNYTSKKEWYPPKNVVPRIFMLKMPIQNNTSPINGWSNNEDKKKSKCRHADDMLAFIIDSHG